MPESNEKSQQTSAVPPISDDPFEPPPTSSSPPSDPAPLIDRPPFEGGDEEP